MLAKAIEVGFLLQAITDLVLEVVPASFRVIDLDFLVVAKGSSIGANRGSLNQVAVFVRLPIYLGTVDPLFSTSRTEIPSVW